MFQNKSVIFIIKNFILIHKIHSVESIKHSGNCGRHFLQLHVTWNFIN